MTSMTLVETIPASSAVSQSSSSIGHDDVVLAKKWRQSEEANSHLEYFTNALVMFVVEGRSRRSVSNQRQQQQQQHASCLYDRLVARLIAEAAQLADSSSHHRFLNSNGSQQNAALPPLRYDYPDIAQVS